MKRLEGEPEIIKLAAGLQVDWQKNAVKSILSLCHQKISGWIKGGQTVGSIQELQELICRRVKLVFEEVWNDEDLAAVIRKYVRLGEPIFGKLKTDLDDKTFATLIERRRIDGRSPDRYVAVIDCRGPKAFRRFFTKWHEIAHLLTLQGQLELPLHRSTTEQTPTERLMDLIAGEVGFYEPIFGPIFDEELGNSGELTFQMVECVRQRFCPEASFHATLNACLRRVTVPVLIVEVRLGLKAHEEKELESTQISLFPKTQPQERLRVKAFVANDAAKQTNLRIHRNMQVPERSVLHRLFFNRDGEPAELIAFENLNIWSSSGQFLPHFEVKIQARRYDDSILAIVSSE